MKIMITIEITKLDKNQMRSVIPDKSNNNRATRKYECFNMRF
jgi:hypothetical protein